MKACFVDQKKDKITIYSIKPKEKEMRLFREQQLALIPKEELFYSSVSVGSGRVDELMKWDSEDSFNVTYPNEMNNSRNIFSSAVNYVSGCGLKFDNDFYDGFIKEDTRTVTDLEANMQIRTLREYLLGENTNVAFVYDPENNTKTKIFLPFSEYSNMHHKLRFRYCLQLSRKAYLLQLLTNNYMQLLDGVSPDEIKELLSLFVINAPIEYSIEMLKERDAYVKGCEKAFYGRVKDPEPFTDKLITQGIFDMPFIEEVKRIALK